MSLICYIYRAIKPLRICKMENNRKKEINKCLMSIKSDHDMQSVFDLHSLIGGVFRHIALRYLSNTQDADDVVQDFWANIFEIASKYHYNTNAFAFLCKAFKNSVLNYCIKKGKEANRKVYYVNYENFASDNGKLIENVVMENSIDIAVSNLSEEQKSVIQLTYFEDLTIREIAKLLNKSKSQIARIKQSALGELKQTLGFGENNSSLNKAVDEAKDGDLV